MRLGIQIVKRWWESNPRRLLQRAVNLARHSDQAGDENLRQREIEQRKAQAEAAAAIKAMQARRVGRSHP